MYIYTFFNINASREIVSSRFEAKRIATKQIVNRYRSNLLLSLFAETNLRDAQADRFVTSQSIKRNLYFPYIVDELIENRFSRLHDHACVCHSSEKIRE